MSLPGRNPASSNPVAGRPDALVPAIAPERRSAGERNQILKLQFSRLRLCGG